MFVRHLSGGELTEYADGEMVGARRRRVQEHLGRCERCAGALAATWEVVGEVRACREAEAPYDLRMRIASRVSAETPSPISCRAAREFIQQGLDGELSLVAAGLLRLHLGECPACAAEQRTLRAATRLVRSLPSVPAPAGIWEKAVAGRRVRPALSWSARLRPVVAAAAMAAGAILLGLHSLPPPASQRAPQHEAAPAAPQTTATAPVQTAPEPAVTEPVAPAPTVVARAEVEAPQPPPVAHTAARQRPSGAVRQAVARDVEQPPIARVIAITTARPETEPKVESAAALSRKSRGLQALAMMAKAVSSESEGRVSLARQSEPWAVFGDETISEVPLTAVVPAAAPGVDSSGAPASRPNTGARDPRPGVAEVMRRAA
jgi:anti-sigma factor RsiW